MSDGDHRNDPQRYIWRERRFRAFARRQETARRWVSARELAERYGRERDTQEGYRLLLSAVLIGKFEQHARCRTMFLSPHSRDCKMTRERLREAVEMYGQEIAISGFLSLCWFPRDLARRWCIDNSVSVAGWLESIEPPEMLKGHGRPAIDDAEAHAFIRKYLASGEPKLTDRELARLAIRKLQLKPPRHGASDCAIFERLRKDIPAIRRGG